MPFPAHELAVWSAPEPAFEDAARGAQADDPGFSAGRERLSSQIACLHREFEAVPAQIHLLRQRSVQDQVFFPDGEVQNRAVGLAADIGHIGADDEVEVGIVTGQGGSVALGQEAERKPALGVCAHPAEAYILLRRLRGRTPPPAPEGIFCLARHTKAHHGVVHREAGIGERPALEANGLVQLVAALRLVQLHLKARTLVFLHADSQYSVA